MLAKVLTILMLLLILGSLFTALLQLSRKRGTDAAVVKALTLRVGLSVGLFVMLLLSFHFGWISPQGMR
jgi:hypothetical protein